MTRFVVAIEHLTLSGGLFRFERLGRALAKTGTGLCWLSLARDPEIRRATDFPLYSLEDFKSGSDDVICIPGAGFSEAYFSRLPDLREELGGRRVQHVLNDPHRLAAFKRVNDAFQPHQVIFNNRHWSPRQAADLIWGDTHVVEGAVDTGVYKLRPEPWSAKRSPRLVALANKNPFPVIEAARALDGRCALVGANPHGLQDDAAVQVHGPLTEAELAGVMQSADFVCHTEIHAGWANIAAEAAAVGTPLIATRAGTGAFLTHGETGFVIDAPTGGAIIAAVKASLAEPRLTAEWAMKARRRVETYSWDRYAAVLAELCQ